VSDLCSKHAHLAPPVPVKSRDVVYDVVV
jgi:hypothetical protein